MRPERSIEGEEVGARLGEERVKSGIEAPVAWPPSDCGGLAHGGGAPKTAKAPSLPEAEFCTPFPPTPQLTGHEARLPATANHQLQAGPLASW